MVYNVLQEKVPVVTKSSFCAWPFGLDYSVGIMRRNPC